MPFRKPVGGGLPRFSEIQSQSDQDQEQERVEQGNGGGGGGDGDEDDEEAAALLLGAGEEMETVVHGDVNFEFRNKEVSRKRRTRDEEDEGREAVQSEENDQVDFGGHDLDGEGARLVQESRIKQTTRNRSNSDTRITVG